MKWNELLKQEGDDGTLALGLQREILDPEIVARFTVEGEPACKARARFSRRNGRHYTPDSTKVAEEHVGWTFRQAGGGRGGPDGKNNFGVYIAFFCSSGQRRDVDNMTKLVFDALNGLAWADDSQVTEQSSKLQRWCADPRTEVIIYLTATQSHPTRPCRQCGQQFGSYPSQLESRQFCTAACGYAWRRDQNRHSCAHCGNSFQSKASRDGSAMYCSRACSSQARTVDVPCAACAATLRRPQSVVDRSGGRSFCDEKCRADHWREHRKAAAKGTCRTCGGPTSKKTYQQCRACVLSRPVGAAP